MVSLNFHCHMACLATMEHLAVMDVTEPKENEAARERLGPGDHMVEKHSRPQCLPTGGSGDTGLRKS